VNSKYFVIFTIFFDISNQRRLDFKGHLWIMFVTNDQKTKTQYLKSKNIKRGRIRCSVIFITSGNKQIIWFSLIN